MAGLAERNFIFIGVMGAGKSYAAQQMMKLRPRRLTVCPKSSTRATYIHTDPEALAEVIRTEEVYDAAWWCGHLDGAEIREGAGVIAEAMYGRRGYKDTLFLDELGVICRGKSGGRSPLGKVERLARMGREVGFSVWFASQRAVDVPPELRQLCQSTLVFKQEELEDVKRLNNIARGLGNAAWDLPPRHYIHLEAGKWRKMPPMGTPLPK